MDGAFVFAFSLPGELHLWAMAHSSSVVGLYLLLAAWEGRRRSPARAVQTHQCQLPSLHCSPRFSLLPGICQRGGWKHGEARRSGKEGDCSASLANSTDFRCGADYSGQRPDPNASQLHTHPKNKIKNHSLVLFSLCLSATMNKRRLGAKAFQKKRRTYQAHCSLPHFSPRFFLFHAYLFPRATCRAPTTVFPRKGPPPSPIHRSFRTARDVLSPSRPANDESSEPDSPNPGSQVYRSRAQRQETRERTASPRRQPRAFSRLWSVAAAKHFG